MGCISCIYPNNTTVVVPIATGLIGYLKGFQAGKNTSVIGGN